jgi:hypothetical protein
MPAAQAGYTTGSGSDRMAWLADPSNDLNVTVLLMESFDGKEANTFEFVLEGSPSTESRSYAVSLIVSPDDPELRLAWDASGAGPAGAATATFVVTVPADDLPYRQPNVPFAVALLDDSGATLDSAEFSMDLLYHAPPADGGLFQLAAATVAAWGLVLLYVVYLSRAHQRLCARADSLERALAGLGKEEEK